MPVLIAQGAGVRRRRRGSWLFQGLDVTVEAGDLVAVVGPPGSGRTTALLALAGKFRLGAGTVEISGRASLGHVPDVSEPESVFTVTEHVRERLMLLGRPRSGAAGVELHGLDPRKQGQDLSPYEKQVLGLVLAELADPAVIALDGYDDGLDRRERVALRNLITRLTARGIAVVITAREMDPDLVTTVIRLGDDPGPPLETPAPSTPPEEEPTPSTSREEVPSTSREERPSAPREEKPGAPREEEPELSTSREEEPQPEQADGTSPEEAR